MKTYFYDVDTQNDFMNKDGALYVPNAETIKPNLRLLTNYAIEKGIVIFGSMDKHFGTEEYKDRELELKKWGGPFPDHCMWKTKGQEKIDETTVERVILSADGYPPICDYKVKQVLFEKQSYDVFYSDTNKGGNRNIVDVLACYNVENIVVYGVATNICVKAAVLGLLGKNIDVSVVIDAIMGVDVNPGDSEKAIEEMMKAGAKFVTTQSVLTRI